MTGDQYACFAHPSVDVAARRARTLELLSDDARTRTRVFLRQFGHEVAGSSSGLVEILTAFAASTGARQDALGFPLSLATFRKPTVDPGWVAASSALHLGAPHWEASFAAPCSLRFKTRATLPLSHARGEDIIADRVACRRVASVALDESDLLLLAPDTRSAFPVEMLDLADSEEPLEASARTLVEAIGLVGAHAPEYLTWIADAICGVVPVRPPSVEGYSSGSTSGQHAVIHASFPMPAYRAAESLIHEASHQYFHFAQLDTLFTNGRDQKLYYSPYPQTDRPIDRILIAFHAFTNVTCFFRALLRARAGVEAEYAEAEIAYHLGCLRPLSDALNASSGLTSDGRALFEATREKLIA